MNAPDHRERAAVGRSLDPQDERRHSRVLIVDDEPVIAETIGEFLMGEGYEVATALDGATALERLAAFAPDVVLCDIQLPGIDGLDFLDRVVRDRPETMVLMITAFATVESAVAAFRRGAHDYLIKPVLFDELLAKLERMAQYRHLVRQNQALRRALQREVGPESLLGVSPQIEEIRAWIRKVGPSPSTVLITGESGTGKELVARALHSLGPAPDEPFLAVNCAALAEEDLEIQLFGQVRSDAHGLEPETVGLFLAAGQGTVFLDEVGELPLAAQAKLLRVIENKEVLPVRATQSVAVRARIIAASNKNLGAEVAAGRFRADLFYRLNVLFLTIPPLRERPEDIPVLVEALLERHARTLGKRIRGVDREAMRLILSAPWRGNVRELENAVQRAIILGEGPTLTAENFPSELVEATGAGEPDDLRSYLAQAERHHLRRILTRCGGDKREAARRLGLGLSSLYRKLDEHNIIL
ncbi:MAG: acetoacetate metabolism regulatory protein AtoC [Isosphaeraceae bacterium]|jgi:DNA-binding NtrC family response regulator|nr:MAG: acetoacetate metabolism regulatory protein AtoC [Isosphaeraceae bacterium]